MKSEMNLSIIIPTYNEEDNIKKTVTFLRRYAVDSWIEIIVSDAGSTDKTIQQAKVAGAHAVVSPGKGRSAQMNYGASLAKGDVLYFVHADCLPPSTFVADLENAISQGYDMGRYQTEFDSNKLILKLNAWFTRFDLFVCMGGDQTLFMKRSLFEECKGFKGDMKIMEEYEFCERARKIGRYKILKGRVLISARKYKTNSWWRVQLANSKVVRMYKNGASQQDMVQAYKQMLNYRKNSF
jgi:rSAM/selenodomain-associated transferase 2